MSLVSLMYHEIATGGDQGEAYAVTAESFTKQLDVLTGNDASSGELPPELAASICRGPSSSTAPNKILLTFDDGHVSNHTIALPLLLERGLEAIFFVTTGNLAREDFFVDEHVRDLSRQGMLIGSHTHSHQFLDGLSEDKIREELKLSKSILEDVIQQPVHYLSCPGGRYDRRVTAIAAELGYHGVFTSEPRSSVIQRDLPVYGRYLIDSSVTSACFERILRQPFGFVFRKKLESVIKSGVKAVLGGRGYHRLWRKFKSRKGADIQS